MGCEEKAFGLLIKNRREDLGFSQKDLAGLLGYKKTVKGIRRIEQLEEGSIVEIVVEKVMAILGLRDEDRAVCKAEDEQRRWECMMANPVTPHVVVRLLAAVHLKEEVPEDATVEEMLEFAREMARERRMKCCLVYSHWLRFWIQEDGTWYRDEEVDRGPGQSWIK